MMLAHPIVELRQYTLHPGARETLIDLFDRAFVAGQEDVGIAVIGQFRDLDRPDRFVWLRGFPDMEARAAALAAFYGGPVWRAHRDAANRTMIDSDNVLRLRPVDVSAPPRLPVWRGTDADGGGIVVATIVPLAAPAEDGFATEFKRTIRLALAASGGAAIAAYETDPGPNTFPALPVREGEPVFVWLSIFVSPAAYADHLVARDASEPWQAGAVPALARWAAGPPGVLRLQPTARSRFRV